MSRRKPPVDEWDSDTDTDSEDSFREYFLEIPRPRHGWRPRRPARKREIVPRDSIMEEMINNYRFWSDSFYYDWRKKIGKELKFKDDKNGLNIQIDCSHYTPKDLTVKVVDGHLIAQGKHKNEHEHGINTCRFYHEYRISKYVNEKKMSAYLGKNGVLTIKAPPKRPGVKIRPGQNRVIPIRFAKKIGLQRVFM